jgi:hypothetical protein
MRQTDAGRWEAGAGVMGGWRPLLDLHLRYYASDAVAFGPRLRLDLDGTPRAAELEFGSAIGQGRMRFPGDRMMRTDLALGWGAGAAHVADHYAVLAFVGLALRVQPSRADWLSFELGVREAWVPSPAPVAARSTTSAPPPAIAHGLATELGASVAVLWPRPRRECVHRTLRTY